MICMFHKEKWGVVFGLLFLVEAFVSGKPPKAQEPLHYDCRAVTETITVDGILEEAAWRDADVILFHVPVTLADPLTPTQGRLCWDANYLYVAFDGVDEDLKGTITTRDSSVYLDDVYEIFIQPGRYEQGYHNFEINILGTVYDAHNAAPGALGSAWNCDGLKFGIQRIGTLNDSTDRDTGWRMEVAIPFAELMGLGKARPDIGDTWPFHIARYDYSVYIPGGKELSSCALLSQAKYHNRAEWIELRFLAPLPPRTPGTGFLVF